MPVLNQLRFDKNDKFLCHSNAVQGPRHRLSLTASSSRFFLAWLCSSTTFPTDTLVSVLNTRELQPPSRWDFYPNCPRSFQWEWEAVPLLPTTPNAGMGSQLYSMFCPGLLSTFTDTLYIKKYTREIQMKHYHYHLILERKLI